MIRLGPLDDSHVAAHNAGEDAEVIRWLTGGPATDETTRRHFAMLAENARRGAGKRGFGVWLDDRLAGYIDVDPDADDLPARGDVNLAYAVHPWARRRGVATAAVNLVCAFVREHRIGTRAVIRTEEGNSASAAVARRCGFEPLVIDTGPVDVGHATLRTWVRILE